MPLQLRGNKLGLSRFTTVEAGEAMPATSKIGSPGMSRRRAPKLPWSNPWS